MTIGVTMIQTEYDLFNYLRNIVPDLTASPNPYSVYDCWSKRFNMYVELKCRRTHYDKLLIEYTKYQRLVTTAFLGRYVPYYVCSTPNGVFAFNLINHSPEWVSELMPATTFGNQTKIPKMIGYLHTSEAEKIWELPILR